MAGLVAIDLAGGPGFVGALQQVWERGDAALPVDQRLAPRARQRLLDAMAPTALLDDGGIHTLDGGRPSEDGDALVMATSGTTGEPKGVVLSHAAVAASAVATTRRLGVDPARHRWLACLPLNHVGGLSVVTRSLLTGTRLTVLAGFEEQAVRNLAGSDVFVSLVTTALRRTPADLFHTVVLGGSAPPAETAPNVVSTYGMTETGSGVVYDGLPLDGVDIRIDDRTQEISVRGPMLLRAYRDGTIPLDEDGWLATGDAGRLDPDGHLIVEGRIGDLIITGGENVWPTPVEASIARHPGVREVAVAGRPHPDWGHEVVAWVVPTDPDTPPHLEELRDLVGDDLARFAAPRRLVLVDVLPRTSLGKVQRTLLPDPDPDPDVP